MSFRQLLEEYTDISSLGDYLDRELPNDLFQDIPSQHAEPVPFHNGTDITQEISIRATFFPDKMQTSQQTKHSKRS